MTAFNVLTTRALAPELVTVCDRLLPSLLKRLGVPGLILLDLEATGFISPGFGITDFGAIVYTAEGLAYSVSTLVNPEKPIGREAVAVTGITNAMVKNAPIWPAVQTELFPLVNGFAVAGFNVKNFDLKGLSHQAHRYGLPEFEFGHVVEVMAAVRTSLNAKSNLNLGQALDLFELKQEGTMHRAVVDAEATLKVMLRVIEEFGLQAVDPKPFVLPAAKRRKEDQVAVSTSAVSKDLAIRRSLLELLRLTDHPITSVISQTRTQTGATDFDIGVCLGKLLKDGIVKAPRIIDSDRLVQLTQAIEPIIDKSKLKPIRDALLINGIVASYVEIQAVLCADLEVA